MKNLMAITAIVALSACEPMLVAMENEPDPVAAFAIPDDVSDFDFKSYAASLGHDDKLCKLVYSRERGRWGQCYDA